MRKILSKFQDSRALFITIVIIPFVLAIAYFSMFSMDRYVSETQIVVKQLDDQTSGTAGLALLTGSSDPSSQEYSLYLQTYIQSYNMLSRLQQEMDWTSHYTGHVSDPLYYLSKHAPKEDELRFYNKVVSARYDNTTGLLDISVQAFTPEVAEKTIEKIIGESQSFIDALSQQVTHKKLQYAEKELKLSLEKYKDSKAKLLAFQDKNQILDADAATQSMLTIESTLETEIVQEKARLKAMRAALPENAPQIKQVQIKIDSLETQLEVEKSKYTSLDNTSANLNAVAAQYRQLVVDTAVTEEFYKTSLAVLENSKYEAAKNARTILTVVAPVRADIPVYPRSIYNLITILIILLFIYGVLRFVIASIRDHYE